MVLTEVKKCVESKEGENIRKIRAPQAKNANNSVENTESNGKFKFY